MNTNKPNVVLQYKNILRIALIVGALLLIPLLAMRFTNDVNWSVMDFAMVGALLLGAGLAFEWGSRGHNGWIYRAAFGLGIGTGLFLTWVNLAVGIIGSEDDPINGLYFLVVLVFIVGSIMVFFKPLGMSRVLALTALAQVIATATAAMLGWVTNPYQTIVLNGFFTAFWLLAAYLFRTVHLAAEARL